MQWFSEATKIAKKDLGESYKHNPESFMGVVRDVAEWAYICHIIDKYGKMLDLVVVKDGRLEQHGVNNSFVQKLRDFFESRQAKVVGVVKSSKLLNGSNGISLLVIAEWIKHLEKEFYFKVPRELMDYVHLHERVWDPNYRVEGELAGFSFGHRYVGRMYAHTFNPLDAMFGMEIPFYFDNSDKSVKDIVSAVIASRCLLYGGSFAPTVEAHAKASISDHIREIVQDYLTEKTGFKYPF